MHEYEIAFGYGYIWGNMSVPVPLVVRVYRPRDCFVHFRWCLWRSTGQPANRQAVRDRTSVRPQSSICPLHLRAGKARDNWPGVTEETSEAAGRTGRRIDWARQVYGTQ